MKIRQKEYSGRIQKKELFVITSILLWFKGDWIENNEIIGYICFKIEALKIGNRRGIKYFIFYFGRKSGKQVWNEEDWELSLWVCFIPMHFEGSSISENRSSVSDIQGWGNILYLGSQICSVNNLPYYGKFSSCLDYVITMKGWMMKMAEAK